MVFPVFTGRPFRGAVIFQAAIPAGSHATVIFCLVRIRVIAGDTLLWLKALNTACTLPLNLTAKSEPAR